MNVISYSLWGSNPVYTIGAIRNARLANILFPEWISVFFVSNDVPIQIVETLKSTPNTVVEKFGNHDLNDSRGMFWRFLPLSDRSIDHVIIRDTDSRLSQREAFAVMEWISKGSLLHIMRDHPYHSVPILGGMWGIKGGYIKNVHEMMQKFAPTALKGQDQEFLAKEIFNPLKQHGNSICVHDPFFDRIPFPKNSIRGAENNGVDFVGQCFDETDHPNSEEDIRVLYDNLCVG